MFHRLYQKLDIPHVPRNRNYPFEKAYRKDATYEILTKKWLRNQKIRKSISELVRIAEIGTGDPMETQYRAFRAYVFALEGFWSGAAEEMYGIIRLENGENVDSWIDLGHFLRKIPQFEYASLTILLNPEKIVRFYREEGLERPFEEFIEKLRPKSWSASFLKNA